MIFNFNFESLSIINKNKIQKIIKRHHEKEKTGKENFKTKQKRENVLIGLNIKRNISMSKTNLVIFKVFMKKKSLFLKRHIEICSDYS
jgi:hypothetical protein